MNNRYKEFYDNEYAKHISENGTMPVECALTNLVCYAIKNKEYNFFTGNGDDFKLYDVIAYKNWSDDVMFGVLTERDSNVLYVKTGTANGVITKILEG